MAPYSVYCSKVPEPILISAQPGLVSWQALEFLCAVQREGYDQKLGFSGNATAAAQHRGSHTLHSSPQTRGNMSRVM